MTWCLYILATACMSIFQGSQTFQKVINLTKFLIISSGIFQGQYIILIRISHIPLLFIITFNLLSECVYLHTYRDVILRVVRVVYRCLVGIYFYIIDKYLHTVASSSCLASCENMHHPSNRIKLSQTKPLPP